MARSISPFLNHELPRATYDFAETTREVCAAAPLNNSNASGAIRRTTQIIRSCGVENAQANACADIAFFIMPPSTTKATICAITRHAVEFFQKLGTRNGHASEGCYNPRHLSYFSLRKYWPMTTPSSQEVTRLLLAWRNGDQEALERLTPLVYGELRRMAHRFMRRERPDHTLQTSALVNEAYLRLVDCRQVDWQNRAHFFGIAAQMMRQILIDHARGHARAKRGGAMRQVSFEETPVVSNGRSAEWIALDDALNDLAAFDLSKSQIVELRFFGGLTNYEVGEVMGMSLRTVEREWRKAKAWLRRAI